MEALGQTSFRLFLGRLFLILIDAHSKWIEAFCVASVTSATTMDCLRQGFEQFVIPEIVATGNGTSPVRNLSLPQEQMAFFV